MQNKPLGRPARVSQPTDDTNKRKSSLLTSVSAERPIITAANSNTKILSGNVRSAYASPKPQPVVSSNRGLNSERLRRHMVDRLRERGIHNQSVLNAMLQVPRHIFIDEGLASRAYEDAALPIGHSQTISQPSIVARMLEILVENRKPRRALEIGTGCGYQAAVMAHVFDEVYSIERIKGLYDMAKQNLRSLNLSTKVRVNYADGMKGLPDLAPFDAIIIAAAGLTIPETLLMQLGVGARLIAPEGGSLQKLVLIERTSERNWERTELEPVRFVPLRSGVQF